MKQFIIAFALITITLTASAQKKDTIAKKEPMFFLIGKLPDYELLLRAIVSPGDVTPNELRGLAQWINQIKPLPEEKQKVEAPKVEKPKN